MTWQPLKVRLYPETDIHCGALVLGFVSETFSYIPQHIPIYAIVPAIVAAFKLPDQRCEYKKVEELIFDNMRATPFFVYDQTSNSPDKILRPWLEAEKETLETRYLDSRYGVMLDLQTRAAEDSRLFETEVILARPKPVQNYKQIAKPTILEGFVWFRAAETQDFILDPDPVKGGITKKDNKQKIAWQELFSKLRLGGDRTRNLGKLAKAEIATAPLWSFLKQKQNSSNWPQLEIMANATNNKCQCPFTLASAKKLNAEQAKDAKLIVATGRRIRKEDGSGYNMAKAKFVYELGFSKLDKFTVELTDKRYAQIVA